MKLTVNLKLQPNTEQANLLRQTMERANAAASYASEVAWTTRTFHQFRLQKLVYGTLKADFALCAQMAVRCVAKVADAYKLDRKTQRIFRPLGAIAYDDRILSFKPEDTVSLWTLQGRQFIPFVCGDYQRHFLPHRKGEVDLIYHGGNFYLNIVCEVEEPPLAESEDFLGVDLGIVNIATDSDGNVYSGAKVEQKRRIFAHRRRNLQRKGTRSARRKLKSIRGKQARFQTDQNHVISKRIVAAAKRTSRGIALENLKGIRERVTARRRQRARLANWGFHQLRSFVEYKARLAGVPVVYVDPRNTSRTCPVCGCIDKANRPDQATFLCVSCGFSGHADAIAAGVIRARALVREPMVAA
jgi:putative transposase